MPDPDNIAGHFDIFDSTALHDFLACPELFRQRHVLGLRKEAPEEAADAGTAFHKGVEAWYNGEEYNFTAEELAIHALQEAWGPVPLIESGKRTLPHYEALLRAYMEQPQHFTVVKNEHFLVGTLGKSAYCGRIDRVIETDDGSRYVMDLKTTSRYLNEAYFASFMLDWQMIGYVALERAKGERCDGIFVDAVHVDTRYQKVKPEHFRRHGPVSYPQWKLDAFVNVLEDAYSAVHEYADSYGAERPWPQHDRSCWRFNKACQFWARCTSDPAIRDMVAGYVEEPWQPNTK